MHAVILARHDIRECDQMITVFSKERGKEHFLARGTKKITSKNAAHLEPCNYVFVEYVPGKQMNHITKIIPIDARKEIRADLTKSVLAQYATHIVDKLLDRDQADPRLFNLLQDFFKSLANMRSAHPLILDALVLQFFAYLGLRPVIEHCVICGADTNLFGFSLLGGGITCSDCRISSFLQEDRIVPCGAGARKVLLFVLSKDLDSISKLRLTPAQYRIIHTIIYGFICHQSDVHIPDWKPVLRILQ